MNINLKRRALFIGLLPLFAGYRKIRAQTPVPPFTTPPLTDDRIPTTIDRPATTGTFSTTQLDRIDPPRFHTMFQVSAGDPITPYDYFLTVEVGTRVFHFTKEDVISILEGREDGRVIHDDSRKNREP